MSLPNHFDLIATDGAGHAGDRNNGIVLHFGLHFFEPDRAHNKKAPDLFRRGFGSEGAGRSTTRANLPKPGRALRFSRCVWSGCSWRGLMREIFAGVNGFPAEISLNEVEQDAVVTP